MDKVTLVYKDQVVEVEVPRDITSLHNFACDHFGISSPNFTYRNMSSSDNLIKSQPDLDILVRLNPNFLVVIDVTEDSLRPTLKLLRFERVDSISTQKSHYSGHSCSDEDLQVDDSEDSIVLEDCYSQPLTNEVAVGRDLLIDTQVNTHEVVFHQVSTETTVQTTDAEIEALLETRLPLEPLVPCVQALLSKVLEGGVAEVVHANSRCSVCGVEPIRGARYVCFECESADFCKGCEGTHVHSVHFIRNASDYAHFNAQLSDLKHLQGLMLANFTTFADLGYTNPADIRAALKKAGFNIQGALNSLFDK
jgi:hypothetical protein